MATPIPTNRAAFTLTEVLSVTGGRAHRADPQGSFVGVSTDTRNVAQGSIFVALRGERFDGHAFAAQAVESGAGLLLVERECNVNAAQVIVDDGLRALGALAAYHRKRWGGAVIAIAGAAGKTTTRSVTSALLTSVVGQEAHSTVGNLNNQIGVPMVLLGLERTHRYAVVEVGTNQLGEVPLLTAIVSPDVSVLTLVDLEHTEGLLSLDAIEQEEGAIFGDTCHTLVVNGDDDRATRQALAAVGRLHSKGATRARVVTYGTRAGVDLKLAARETQSAFVSRLTLTRAGEILDVRLGLIGAPAAYAVMAGVAATEALLGRALHVEELQRGLSSQELKPEGRAEIVTGPLGALIINDSYNANPASMQRALETATELVKLRGGRLHLVLGEMRELGSLSEQAHETLAAQVRETPWSSLFAVGKEMVPCVKALQSQGVASRVLRHDFDTQGVATQLSQLLGPSDVVLVKGSRGVRTEVVIAELVPKVS